MVDLLVIGGGAAGFFGAIAAAGAAAADSRRPFRCLLIEQGRDVLAKVRISGGGRCNVTHAEFDSAALVAHYPRGRRELLGPMHRFAPGDTMAWFEDRGVALKIEADGRVFPVCDDSAAIVDALVGAARASGVEVRLKTRLLGLAPVGDGAGYAVETSGGRLSAKRVLLATGSSPAVYRLLASAGIPVVDPVPSLFTFNLPGAAPLRELQGVSVTDAVIELPGLPYRTQGSLLVTHWGLSGPAVLRMSALAAVELHGANYDHPVRVDWLGTGFAETRDYLVAARRQSPKATLRQDLALGLPKRLWNYLVARAGLSLDQRWADLRAEQLDALAAAIAADPYDMQGQTRFKEEFVTAGGIARTAVDFRDFSVKGWPGLHVAGEVIDIDGITGGFNFQAAWTGGYLAGRAIGAAHHES